MTEPGKPAQADEPDAMPDEAIGPAAAGLTAGSDLQSSLLSMYAAQFNSYLSMLWQVPALALTAQSFLLTIALTHDSSNGARIMAAGLGMAIALASAALMHDQRGFAITHAFFVRQLSRQSALISGLPAVTVDDAEPQMLATPDSEPRLMPVAARLRRSVGRLLGFRLMPGFARPTGRRMAEIPGAHINAVNVWDVPHRIYHVWRWCLLIFVAAYVVIIVSAVFDYQWFM